jgi:hypothetical protein
MGTGRKNEPQAGKENEVATMIVELSAWSNEL